MTRARTATLALVVDLMMVVVFVTIGPGTAAGWAASRGWRAPTSVLATGVPVWASTVVGGMLFRRIVDEGTAASFVVVATVVLGALLLGWRAAANRRRPRE